MPVSRRNLVVSLASAPWLGPSLAQAQRYPDKPIRLVVPYAAGGGTDILARTVAGRVSEFLGQSLVVDNKGGAGGNIGADIVAKAAPDGYTLLMAANTIAINAALQKLPFDPVQDFVPVAALAAAPMVLVVHPSVAANSVRELVAQAKAAPGKLNYSNPGNGTPQHLAAALFSIMAGADITHIVYKGAGPATADLVAGQTQVAFMTLAAVKQHIDAGKLKALAVATAQRSRTMPGLPTVAEAGLPGYQVDLWFGVMAPAKMPRELVARLNTEFNRALVAPEVGERLATLGYEAWMGAPEILGEQMKRDLIKYADIVKRGNIKLE
jgi:tripartite-type tricarboxylate transporter receptor subunit TctC